MDEYESIAEVLKAYPKGKGLGVQIDNDVTYVCIEGDDDNIIFTGEGYQDVYELWELLFSKATVEGV